MGIGNEKLEMNIRPHKIRFDDNQWHSISVRRKVQLVRATFFFCPSAFNKNY